ncbi:MAG: hypothetical protein ACPGQV_01665 [Alphaproteobacteria bacterium]
MKSLEGQLETVSLTRSRQGAAMTGHGTQQHSRLRPALELMCVGVDEISAGEAAGTLTLSCYGTFLMQLADAAVSSLSGIAPRYRY